MKVLLFTFYFLFFSSFAVAKPPLGEAVRQKSEILNHQSSIINPQSSPPPLGEAIRQQSAIIPSAPSKSEWAISRQEFAEAHWHGLELITITPKMRQKFIIPQEVKGVFVDEVTLEGVNCGFLAGDIVQNVEGYPTPDLREFLKATMKVQDKFAANIDVIRQGEVLTLTLKAASYYDRMGFANMEGGEASPPGTSISPLDAEMFQAVPPGQAVLHKIQPLTGTPPPVTPPVKVKEQNVAVTSSLAWVGVEVVSVDSVIAEQFGLLEVSGVLINKVEPSSPAKEAGLRRGDVLKTVGKIKISDVNHLQDIIAPLKPGEEVEVSLIRRGKKYTISLFLGEKPTFKERYGGNMLRVEMLLVVAIFALIYFLVFQEIFGFMPTFLLGAVLVLVLGAKFQFYDLIQGLRAIKYNILAFIVGMNLISAVLREAGFFDYIAKKITLFTRGDRFKMLLLFCLITYIISCFMDNIATILVIVPLTLILAKDLNFNPKPLIIAVIISSNVGGASTMVGDFPNMLIGLSTEVQFHDFIFYLMPICLILMVAMLIYIRVSQQNFFRGPKYSSKDIERDPLFIEIKKGLKTAIKSKKAVVRCLIVLGLVILGLILSGKIGVNPAAVALSGGILILLISGLPKGPIFKLAGWRDVMFFAALFIMVGAAEASGLLFLLAEGILKISFGHVLMMALFMMWLAAFMTAFMSAGPTAAIFIPVVMYFGIRPPHYLFWWALSLGVLAGSSATLTGASGGPLAYSLIGKFWKKHKKTIKYDSPLWDLKKALGFREYLKVGGPIMFIFLLISSIYIMFLYLL